MTTKPTHKMDAASRLRHLEAIADARLAAARRAGDARNATARELFAEQKALAEIEGEAAASLSRRTLLCQNVKNPDGSPKVDPAAAEAQAEGLRERITGLENDLERQTDELADAQEAWAVAGQLLNACRAFAVQLGLDLPTEHRHRAPDPVERMHEVEQERLSKVRAAAGVSQ
ncbi:hypothetical protein OEZ71_13465 [Defluviimonas sp. WL0050]|uniref:Uncharacterized protein n=1 Tax=Albidovulum litorale TaxID=2984134 RepID=A0ABT2ZQ63_9RHOB|nr:hypothetical protein [Defluviimonas sp. WL0050]MCV2873302.1 hypothetical protein [Defluviimonas sp. WL0050]